MSPGAIASAVQGADGAAAGEVWRALAGVRDPEIPVLSIVDLGVVRYVRRGNDGRLHVGLTPTYSGCPATEVIRARARAALDALGHPDALLEEVLSPPWTSDWLSAAAHAKLTVYGIAPPAHAVSSPRHLGHVRLASCPRCGSQATERISEFGSTPCKAHYRCTVCREPFDAFKCI